MTEDDGGGQNIGYLDSADYADYVINVQKAGLYDLSYRVASDGSQDYANGGTIKLLLMEDSVAEELHTVSFPATNGWQDWENTSNAVDLPEGNFIMWLRVVEGPFNLNWISFDDSVSVGIPKSPSVVIITWLVWLLAPKPIIPLEGFCISKALLPGLEAFKLSPSRVPRT